MIQVRSEQTFADRLISLNRLMSLAKRVHFAFFIILSQLQKGEVERFCCFD